MCHCVWSGFQIFWGSPNFTAHQSVEVGKCVASIIKMSDILIELSGKSVKCVWPRTKESLVWEWVNWMSNKLTAQPKMSKIEYPKCVAVGWYTYFFMRHCCFSCTSNPNCYKLTIKSLADSWSPWPQPLKYWLNWKNITWWWCAE